MTVSDQVDLGTLARVGTALADPTRRRVLVHLIDGPGYPAEMAEEFGTAPGEPVAWEYYTVLEHIETS